VRKVDQDHAIGDNAGKVVTQTFGTSKQLAERRTLAFAVPIAALALLLAGCVTEYYPYQGAAR